MHVTEKSVGQFHVELINNRGCVQELRHFSDCCSSTSSMRKSAITCSVPSRRPMNEDELFIDFELLDSCRSDSAANWTPAIHPSVLVATVWTSPRERSRPHWHMNVRTSSSSSRRSASRISASRPRARHRWIGRTGSTRVPKTTCVVVGSRSTKVTSPPRSEGATSCRSSKTSHVGSDHRAISLTNEATTSPMSSGPSASRSSASEAPSGSTAASEDTTDVQKRSSL